ncbi:hypothetical protein J437_LFUL003293, partial [Ladona fulva]
MTIWRKKSYSKSLKIKAKNIVKIFPTAANYAKHVANEFEVFKKFITIKMIDQIVKFSNIHIKWVTEKCQREQADIDWYAKEEQKRNTPQFLLAKNKEIGSVQLGYQKDKMLSSLTTKIKNRDI